jgi:GNAT superfamily N-acetyltransferase
MNTTIDRNVKIRKAKPEDVGSILKLIKALADYEKLSDQVIATEEDLFTNGFEKHRYFETILCEVDRRIVGFALYFFTFSTFLGRPTLYLEDLFVIAEFRGRGLGRLLFEELVYIAEQKKCGRVEWAVLDWNAPSIDFYKSIGATAKREWTIFQLDEEGIKSVLRSRSRLTA